MSLTLSGTNGVVGAGFTVDNSGVSVTAGVGTFTSYQGSAASLTQIPAANIVGVCTAGLASASGVLAGVTEVDHYYLPSNWSTSGAIITSWVRMTQANVSGASPLGTGMTHNSGTFTFPSTGKYLIIGTAHFTIAANDNVLMQTKVTVDNSNYYVHTTCKDGNPAGDVKTGGSSSFAFVDVTDTSLVKVHIYATSIASGSNLNGHDSSDGVQTGVMFIRLGDT